MNQTKPFRTERISQIVKDIGERIITNVFIPDEILYSPVKLDLSQTPRFRPFRTGDTWGGFDELGWFRYEITVPEEFHGKSLWLELSPDKQGWYAQNPQYLAFLEGKALQGFDMYHSECLLLKNARAGRSYTIDVDAWSGMVTRGRSWSDRENRRSLFPIRFYSKDPVLDDFYHNIRVPYEILKIHGENSEIGRDLAKVLTEAVNKIDTRDMSKEEFKKSLEEADRHLREKIYHGRAAEDKITARCVGHTHIDVAWMWQFKHTRMKVKRSFSTALKLLEEYPDFVFMSSQPLLYQYFQEELPSQFKRIKSYVDEGRWETEGGMWIEADCNLTSGESLIRQFLLGKEYFRKTFGRENRVLWLPDVFGYSAALPQICRKCGIDYFMTTKISWNEQNKIPYDTFLWKGIDGSEVLTHFSPAKRFGNKEVSPFGFARSPHITTYNAELDPDHLIGGWDRYGQKELNREFLVAYGHGDGGGGTTREMIENGKRLRQGITGCPQVQFSGVLDFFENLQRDVGGQDDLPLWYGELYLEFHRGTYTSVGKIKKLNRRAENLLQRCENLSVLMRELTRETYPGAEIKEALGKMLTNQFHDILPGTSLDSVYDDCYAIYDEIFNCLEDNMERAIGKLLSLTGKGLVVFNTLGFNRSGFITFEYQSESQTLCLEDRTGGIFTAQCIGPAKYIAHMENIPGSGFRLFGVKPQHPPAPCVLLGDNTITTDLYIIGLGDKGQLKSIFDKREGREILKGPGNVLEIYEDRPYQYDAWELNSYYRCKKWVVDDLIDMELMENGPVRACLRFRYRFQSSLIVQKMYLYNHSHRIDFLTDVEWNEEHLLLKAAFPVDIITPRASYEIQFGYVERPTHTNTTWDAARFESCAHRWADLSDTGYGVSLLNDCKYGYDIHDNIMRLTLLRSATFPNTKDRGHHSFTYSLYPHRGVWQESSLISHACDLNNPMIGRFSNMGSYNPMEIYSLITCTTEGIIIETVKEAEGGGALIIRIYEAYGRRCRAGFILDRERDIDACNMLEDREQELFKGKRDFDLMFTPFEIKTLRVQ